MPTKTMIAVKNVGKTKITLLTGEAIEPSRTIHIESEGYKENLPWIKGQKVDIDLVQIDSQSKKFVSKDAPKEPDE